MVVQMKDSILESLSISVISLAAQVVIMKPCQKNYHRQPRGRYLLF